jgi:hypothetical protein
MMKLASLQAEIVNLARDSRGSPTCTLRFENGDLSDVDVEALSVLLGIFSKIERDVELNGWLMVTDITLRAKIIDGNFDVLIEFMSGLETLDQKTTSRSLLKADAKLMRSML